MNEIPNTVMEVVITYFILYIVFHFTYINNWGLTNASRLFSLTKEAIELVYHTVYQYEEINLAGTRNHVTLQKHT